MRVAVVGGGVAGLAAALDLSEAGADVVVLRVESGVPRDLFEGREFARDQRNACGHRFEKWNELLRAVARSFHVLLHRSYRRAAKKIADHTHVGIS